MPRRVLPSFVLVLLSLLPSSLAAQPPAPAPGAGDTRDAFLESVNYRTSFDERGRRTSDVTMHMRVNTLAGVQEAGTIAIPFRQGATTLRVKYVRGRKPDGSIVETPLTPVFDLPAPATQLAPTYSDVFLRHINVQALRPGDLLEFAWESEEASQLPGHFEDTISLSSFESGRVDVEVSWPTAAAPLVHSPAHTPKIETAGGRTTYRWSSGLSQPRDDRGGADDGPIAPEIQISSFREWADVGAAVRTLWRTRADVTPEVRAKALELTAGLTTNEARARALYRYVATEIRYVAILVGLSSIQPNPAATVLANGFGDCKDKHVLLEALLRAVGIESMPALIAPDRELDEWIPSLRPFTHVITYVDQGLLSPIWLDTTLEVAPFGFLIANERDAKVLAIPAAGPARMVTTPREASRRGAWRSEIDGRVTSGGRLEATVREILSGDIEVLLRAAFRASGRENWAQIVRSFPLLESRGGTISDIVISPPEDTDEPFRVEYRYVIDALDNWNGGNFYPPVSIPMTDQSGLPGWARGPRGATAFVAVSRLELPEDIELLSNSSPPVELTRSVGTYRFRWSVDGRVLSSTREYEPNPTEWKAETREEYRAFLADANKSAYFIRFRRVAPWAWADVPTIDWYENASDSARKTLGTAATMGRRGDYQEGMAVVRRVLQDEPDSDAAWQMLAWLQYTSGSRDRAVETLQRRMLSVSGPSLIKYYAQRLGDMGQRDQAISVLRVGRERFPDDREFPLYLAERLLAAGRAAEAVEVLASQATIQQASARFHSTLARGYLQSGRTDEGIVAALHAAELDGSASNLNTSAWMLGDRGIALDDALRLSERSIQVLAEQLRSQRLESAGVAQLRVVSMLAMNWDTLGWIHFKRRDHATALRYLDAAWNLSHDPIIARHVAALHEAAGNAGPAARYRTFADAVDQGATARIFVTNDPGEVARVTDARNALDRARTFALPDGIGINSPVDVLLEIDSTGRVRDVRSFGTNARSPSLSDALLSATIPWSVPDSEVTQIIRRGRVSCAPQGGGCAVVLSTTTQATVDLPE